MARLVFLGRLEDLAGAPELSAPGDASLAEMLAGLPASLAEAVSSPKVRVAVNGVLIGAETSFGAVRVADGDEVAFLPPVSGG